MNVFITVDSLLLNGYMLRSILPYLGDEKSTERLKKLDSKIVTIFAIIGITFSKSIEGIFNIIIKNYPIVVYGVDLSQTVWYMSVGIVASLMLIFGFDVYLEKKKQEVADSIDIDRNESLDKYRD